MHDHVEQNVNYNFRRILFGAAALLLSAGLSMQSASGQPVFQGSLACAAGAPTAQTAVNPVLGALVDPTKGDALNTAWTQNVEPAIEKQTIIQNRVHIPDGCDAGGDSFCATKGRTCSFVYVDITMHALAGLDKLRFTTLDVGKLNPRNVAAHTNRGPDASVITDGVFAAEGHSSTDTAYAIVLPHNGAKGAIVIDLGTTTTVCGVSSACNAPKIQADNDDDYELDYSIDGTTWTKFATFPRASNAGLQTRPLSDTKLAPSFTARYVAVSASGSGSTFAISELRLHDTGNHLVSLGKRAIGPVPFEIVDGAAVSDGTSSTDANVSVVLVHKTGSATALMIDLGRVVQICGSGYVCASEPTIQADNDDTYMFDYSLDGKDWTTYGYMDDEGTWHGTFPSVGGSHLQTRNMKCSARPDPSTDCGPTNHGPNFSARYVRVYARDGGDTFAVSELKLWDTASNPVLPAPTYSSPQAYAVASYSPQAWGPEPFFINGEFAPEGTTWDDGHYATKLGSCTANSNSKCPVAAPGTAAPITNALQIDLTATFPISGITIQADNNDTYQVDGSLDGTAWTALWTVPKASNGGLRTRTVTIPSTSQQQARYVRVYATEGDGSFSVSELQVFTAQANTAGAYATDIDNQNFTWSDGRANDGQNFACSYDGTVHSVLSGFAVPITYIVDSVSLNARCVTSTLGDDYNIASAHDRSCSMTLTPPVGYNPNGGPPFTDRFQAGFCTSTNVSAQPSALLSFLHFDDSGDTTEYSVIQFDSADNTNPTGVSDLTCSDWDSLDAHIPDVLRGLVPKIAAGAMKAGMNAALDYHPPNNALIPFPRNISQPKPYPPIQCGGALTVGEPPTAAPDNLSGLAGRATQVGSGSNGATLRISGRFSTDQAVALDQAGITIDALLHEVGVGELVQGASNDLLVPVGLQPLNGSKANKGLYQTPPGSAPIVSAQIDAQNGFMTFEIDVERAMIASPSACLKGSAAAPLKTSFQLVGASEQPTWVHATANWRCNGAQLQTP